MNYRVRMYIATESNIIFDKGYLYLYILSSSEDVNSLNSMQLFLDNNANLDCDSVLGLYKITNLTKNTETVESKTTAVLVNQFFKLLEQHKLMIIKDCILTCDIQK